MNPSDLEQLLVTRGQRLKKEPAISAEAEAQVYAELKQDATAARPRASRPRLLRGLLLAAAASVLFMLWPELSRDFGRAACQLALLDNGGRSLETVERSSARDNFRRPEAVLVEYVATEQAFVRIAVIDALGFLRNLELDSTSDQPIEAGKDGIVSLDLELFETNEAADSLVSILLVSSQELIPANEWADRLPQRIESDSGADRAQILQSLARTLESDLGCTVLFETFTLERQ